MAFIVVYILIFWLWLYALSRSISYSGIDAGMDMSVSIHWSQVLFWIAIGSIFSGSVLTLLTGNFLYLLLTVFGIAVEFSVVLWVFFELSWDERAMLYKRTQYRYLRLPRTPKSVRALEQIVSGRLDRILYWGLAGSGIALSLIYGKLIYAFALCSLSLATATVISQCRFLRYAAVTGSELLIRYGTPPFRLRRMGLNTTTKVYCHVEQDRIRLTLHDGHNEAFSINVPPASNVARIVLSHLKKPGMIKSV